MKKIVCIIPARYQSSRFPGKPLVLINNKPMIQWVYEGVKSTQGIDEVYIATDDIRIFEVVTKFGGEAIMTSANHQSGSDRIAECVDFLKLDDEDIVLNIQGDEPLITSLIIDDLMNTMQDPDVYMGTLMEKITDISDVDNENIVKVIVDKNNYAVYFSRSAIPYLRNKKEDFFYFRHLGLYAYKVGFLKAFTKWPKSELEYYEGLEQLRVLENGYKIKVLETLHKTLGVDIPEQIGEVEKIMKERGSV